MRQSEILDKAIKDQNKELLISSETEGLKLRSIVGGPKQLTKRLSIFLDLTLKP